LDGGGQISPSPIDFHRRPYNTLALLALPCERVIYGFPSSKLVKDVGKCRLSVNRDMFRIPNVTSLMTKLPVIYYVQITLNGPDFIGDPGL